MKIINIHKAEGKEVQSLQINADQPHSYNPKITLNEMHQSWSEEGKMLSDALFDHLPGGLIDGLLVAMMQRRASLLIVKF